MRTGVEGSFRINREEKVFTILSITNPTKSMIACVCVW